MNDAITTKTSTGQTGRCQKLECTVDVTGECYEGITDFTTCPNYALSIDDTIDDEASDDEINELDSDKTDSPDGGLIDLGQPNINLYAGNELDYADSLRITRAASTKVVVIVGANDSGKTTLLNSIYEHFLQGAISSYLFAGSETLAPFDRRCHLSRTDSERQTEDTERTKSFSEQTMLHLRVRHNSLVTPIQSLLLSDIRGELFNKAIEFQTEAQRIKILKRADHLAILIDGAKLADLKQRNQAAIIAQMTLRSFLEAGMIGKQTMVEILFNKEDLMQKNDWGRIQTLLNEVEREILQKHEQSIGRISFHRIVARAEENVETRGIPDIFRRWMEDSVEITTKSSLSKFELPVSSPREFDRFALVQMPSRFIEPLSS